MHQSGTYVPHYWTASLALASSVLSPFVTAVPPLLDNCGLSTASAIMSKVTEMVNDVTLQKTLPETSAGEISKTYELDGIDDQDVNHDDYHHHLGVTRNDRRDMTRMGKIQQLRVSGPAPHARSRFS